MMSWVVRRVSRSSWAALERRFSSSSSLKVRPVARVHRGAEVGQGNVELRRQAGQIRGAVVFLDLRRAASTAPLPEASSKSSGVVQQLEAAASPWWPG